MDKLTFDPEISIGNIITLSSVAVSVIALLIAWSKDRNLRKKEYSDRIRRSTGTVIAKLERWKEIAQNFFENIQPLITDADAMLIRPLPSDENNVEKEKRCIDVRDFFWQQLVKARSDTLQKILDEQVEIAYIDLYGYDPRIQALFVGAILRIKLINSEIYGKLLEWTQRDTLNLANYNKPFHSAQLGNALRATCGIFSQIQSALIGDIINSFRGEMLKLIEAKDSRIVKRKIRIANVDEIFKSVQYTEQEVHSAIVIKKNVDK